MCIMLGSRFWDSRVRHVRYLRPALRPTLHYEILEPHENAAKFMKRPNHTALPDLRRNLSSPWSSDLRLPISRALIYNNAEIDDVVNPMAVGSVQR
jgi:hypothetical protein